jgi:hypothetical protein
MSGLFITFVASVVALVGVALGRSRGSGLRIPGWVGLMTWIAYATAMGYWGPNRFGSGSPPLPLLLTIPAVVLVLFMARSVYGGRLAAGLPAAAFIGLESFRVVVEIFLHQLWLDGLVPRMMTFEGANVDIIIGASAPVIAWLLATRRIGPRMALVWNGAGILTLLNVIVRSVLTTPGPTHLLTSDLANRAVTLFPYTFIPAFLAPLAMLLHVLSIRSLTRAYLTLSAPSAAAMTTASDHRLLPRLLRRT